MNPQDQVRDFHEAFGLPASDRPKHDVPWDLAQFRTRLLRDEFFEYVDAVNGDFDLAAIAQELADVVIVAYGTAITYGIDLDAVITEVMRANMSKLGPDGKPVLRADGKVVKPAGWQPPDVAGVLWDQVVPS